MGSQNYCPYQDSNPRPSSWWNRCYTDHATWAPKIIVPIRIRTPDHPAGGTDAILTMLHGLPKFHLRTGHEHLTLAAFHPGKKVCTRCWVDPRDSLDWCSKSRAHTRNQPPNGSGCSELMHSCHEGVKAEYRVDSYLSIR